MPSPISRRTFGASLAGALSFSAVGRAQTQPPNILFLMAANVRGDALGYMGHPVVKTPSLNALAREGVALTRCFTPASGGAPAQVSALSGRYPHSHGVTADGAPLADPGILLPRLLAAQGYRTGMVGDLEITGHEAADIFERCSTFADDYRAFLDEKFPELGGDFDALARPIMGQGRPLWKSGASRLSAQDAPEAWAAGKVIEFAEAAKAGEPWFLFAGFRHAKDAYLAPFPWAERYPREQIPVPRLPEERPAPPTALDRPEDYVLKSQEPTVIDVRRAYYGGIAYLDEQIGVIVRRLRALNQLESTLIVFTSAQGDMLGDLGRMGGSTPYDGATHVPCMMHYEAGFKITGGVNRVADTTCIAPTILELAGIEAPSGFESPSAKEILTVVGADWDEAAFHDHGFQCLRTKNWKLAEPGSQPTWAPQLFDLEKDPRETANLYGKPEAAAEQQKLAKQLQVWKEAAAMPSKG